MMVMMMMIVGRTYTQQCVLVYTRSVKSSKKHLVQHRTYTFEKEPLTPSTASREHMRA